MLVACLLQHVHFDEMTSRRVDVTLALSSCADWNIHFRVSFEEFKWVRALGWIAGYAGFIADIIKVVQRPYDTLSGLYSDVPGTRGCPYHWPCLSQG